MKRAEELALIRAVLAIGVKVAAMRPDPQFAFATGEQPIGAAMFYKTDDQRELGEALVPLRQILDGNFKE